MKRGKTYKMENLSEKYAAQKMQRGPYGGEMQRRTYWRRGTNWYDDMMYRDKGC